METNLVTKYRPRCLSDILGQPEVVRALKTFILEPYPAALLFHGNTGTGKTSAAIALACELGCSVEDADFSGLYQIPSGDMGADEVRAMLRQLQFRPLMGKGWRVLICNEGERMARPAETIWLDALENLPPQCLVIFTTNAINKFAPRFRDRCEVFEFRSETEKLRPAIRELVRKIWKAEVGQGDCPAVDTLGMPTLTGPDSMHASFRLALQQLQRYVREAKAQPIMSATV